MNRGDLVLVDWPYSDRTGSKVRPALLVQADFLNGKIDDTILLSITRRARSASETEVLIDPATEPQSGLRQVSVVSCTNFQTLDQLLILRRLGELSAATTQQVNDCLKKVLNLP